MRCCREVVTSPPTSQTAEFERAVSPLRAELQRVARRYTGNAHDAEDLVQETLAKAWTGFGSFDPGTNLRAWLFRIMVNTWISGHRRTERRPRELLTARRTPRPGSAGWGSSPAFNRSSPGSPGN